MYVSGALILPPIFIRQDSSAVQPENFNEFLYQFPNFSLTAILYFIFWCTIFCVICVFYNRSLSNNLQKTKPSIKTCIAKSFITFSAIVAFWTVVSLLFSSKLQAAPSKTNARWILFFAGVFCAAAFEECLYRLYLPESFQFLIENTKLKSKNARFYKIFQIAAEILCVLLFALAHRYLGILAVLNALFAGSVLRRLAKQTNIICSWLVHSLYNCLIFAFAIFQ